MIATKSSSIQRKLGERIRERRKELDLSQDDLSAKTKLDRTYISGIERGLRNPALKNLNKLANALKISIDQLMKF